LQFDTARALRIAGLFTWKSAAFKGFCYLEETNETPPRRGASVK
jgi:hypothetical protein